MRFIFLANFMAAILSAQGISAAPPLTFLNETGTQFITMETLDGGKFRVALRSVGEPGSYWNRSGTGQKMPKGIEFSLKSGEGDPAGPVYLATGSATRLTVKLKPGQDGVQDDGLSGVYRHATDEKIALLAKKDCDAVEKKLNEAIKLASSKASAEDKPAYVEWKKAWPALRDRLFALNGSKWAAQVPGAAAPEPSEKQAAYWMKRAEVIAAAINFISGEMPKGLKSGWKGNFDDGFGGAIEIFIVSNGDARFTINAARGQEGMSGMIEGGLPAKMIKTASDGTSTGEFTEKNTTLKEGEQPTHLHFRRIGHFLIVESRYAERYAGRGWFDGIYVMRPAQKDE